MSGYDDHHFAPGTDSHLLGAAREGCRESRLLLSRRSMLGVTASLFTAAFLPDFARADTDPQARFLVVILRGGMDGVGMVIPKLDPHYVPMRRELALPFSATLSLGADFALHPALTNVHKMFGAGDAVIVPAAGIPLQNRSHFECQDNLENGLPVNTTNATGWLNRLFGALPAGDPVRTRRGLEIGEAPMILRGPEPVLGWSPPWFQKSDPDTIVRLASPYTMLAPDLWDSLQRGLATDALALAADAGSSDDISQLRKSFIGAARLIRASSGPRIAVVSVEGWDTHADQGGTTGFFKDRLAELDQALADVKSALGPVWRKTVVCCVSEFGRTIRTNGDHGTDHGAATVALLVGGALKGGIAGDWPGMSEKQLFDDTALKASVDLRAVFKGVLRDHIGVPGGILNTIVFPESADVKPMGKLIAVPEAPTSRLSAYTTPPSPAESAPILRYRKKYGT